MTFSTRNLLLAAALLAVPAPALLAQQGGGYGYPQGGEQGQHEGQHEGRGDRAQGERGQRGMRSPVAALVEHRADLNLSDDQVSRLQRIDQDLQRRTEPLRQQLQQSRGQNGQNGDADREAMRQRMEQSRPLFDQLRKYNDDAMQQAMRVLSSQQRETAKSLMPQRGEGRGGRGGQGRGQGQGQSSGGWSRGVGGGSR
ncbi:MAG: hypothetical protein JWM27_4301 [Gemmatimonadetes bacterium]|nr:hypothetical protein [Gemmatimonadota bacterium]